MSRILDTTFDREMRARSAASGHGFRIHQACRERYTLPASVVTELRIDYRARRRDGQQIAEARSKALVYLDGYIAGWRAVYDGWYTRQEASA